MVLLRPLPRHLLTRNVLPGLARRLLPLPRLTLELLWLPLLPLARRRRLLPLCRLSLELLSLELLALKLLALKLLALKLLSLELLSRNLLRLPLLPLAGHGLRLLVRSLLVRTLLTGSGLPRVRRWILPHLLFPRVLSHPLPRVLSHWQILSQDGHSSPAEHDWQS